MNVNPREYLISKGMNFKENGKELILEVCPMCQDHKGTHFYMNAETSQWKCHKCGESGNIFTLKQHLGDILRVHDTRNNDIRVNRKKPKPIQKDLEKFHAALLKCPSAMEYLKDKRGFTDEIIKKFKLQFMIKGFKDKKTGDFSEKNAIGFPLIYEGIHVNNKWRSPNKEMIFETGCEITLFNIDAIDRTKPLLIVEGEYDCMAADQLEFSNVVSVSAGAKTFKDEWLPDLNDCEEILLCYDNDHDGEDGASRAASKLGPARCKRVLPPFKDMNDCLLQGMTHDQIQEYLNRAREYKPNELLLYLDLIERVRADIYSEEKQGVKTGWQCFDDHIGGIRPGEVTAITGQTSVGKTTFVCNLSKRLEDHGVVWVSTETSNEKIIRKHYCQYLGRFVDRKIPEAELERAESYFAGKRLYFLDIHGGVSFEKIRDTIEYVARRGVKIAILDHLHFFLTAKSLDSDTIEIQRFMRSLVRLAHDTDIHIFLVVHPTKTLNGAVIKPTDMKGSSAIMQDSHNILSLWREKHDSDCPTILFIQKVRDDDGITGMVRFRFDHASQTYTEKTTMIDNNRGLWDAPDC